MPDTPDEPRPAAVITPRRRIAAVVAALGFTFTWATLCNATLDLVQARGEDRASTLAWELLEGRWVFLMSSGVLWLLLLGLVALTGRVFLSAAALSVLTIVVAFANHEKMQLRAEPLFPSDLAFAGEAGFLREMVGIRPVIAVGGVVLLVVGALLLAGRLVSRHLPPIRRRAEPRTWVAWVVGRGLVVLTVGLVGTQLASFNAPGNPVKKGYVAAGAKWAFWSQEANYLRHGVVAGLLYNLDVPPMAPPEGYSRATMTDIADHYAAVADRMNHERDGALLDDLNVVVVLSEALSDPTIVPGVELDEDPIPFTRRLMASTTSGAMLSSQLGGGTANMEFEAITGLSLSQFQPQLTSPYPMLVADETSFPSAVKVFELLGKRPVAVHPFDPHMYKRDRVYRALGFDEFIDQDTMGPSARIGRTRYISDAAAFDEVRDQLEENDAPLFVNLVTMQNHFPTAGKYDDPIGVSGVSESTARQLGGYARGLRHSDDALRELIRDLRRSDEPTAVVLYGDHTPAFWARDPAFVPHHPLLRQTPFLLWSNVRDLPAEELPLTSPVFFVPLLLDRLDLPVPPLYALLTQLHEEVPAMSLGAYHAADGSVTSVTSATGVDGVTGLDGLGERARDLLADYRLVQYDLAAGHRYAEERLLATGSTARDEGGQRR